MVYKPTNTENEQTERIITCECGTHIVMIQEWNHPEETDVDTQSFEMAIFQYGLYNARVSFWRRLRWAWKLIWTGKYFSDEICMTPGDAKQLADFINERIEIKAKNK